MGYDSWTVATVSPGLLGEALAALDCVDVRELKGGAQKAVRLVQRGGENAVLKVITLAGARVEALRRAEREVSLLAALDSKHIVRVTHDLVEIGSPAVGAAWLEEYLDGDDLAALLGQDPWDWFSVAALASDVSDGLGVAHRMGVVHRDLSPNNIRRLSSGSYKVMDFGFARFTLRSGLTVAGQPGTPGYMSPEHVNSYSGVPTPASDVFSLGILMYQLLSGNVPIPYDGDDADYVKRLQGVRMRPLSEVRPDLESSQMAFVQRCLHPQPARRFLNGSRVVAALEALR